MAKTGSNDPCPCGSGKKYKKCCGGLPAMTNVQKNSKTPEQTFTTQVPAMGIPGEAQEMILCNVFKGADLEISVDRQVFQGCTESPFFLNVQAIGRRRKIPSRSPIRYRGIRTWRSRGRHSAHQEIPTPIRSKSTPERHTVRSSSRVCRTRRDFWARLFRIRSRQAIKTMHSKEPMTR
jgi:hypothetical protein